MKRLLVAASALALAGCGSDDPGGPSGSDLSLPGAAFNLPAVETGDPYSETVEPTGGSPPYIWTVEEEALPPGITATGNGAALTLSGTPTQSGQYVFDITVADQEGAGVTAAATIWAIQNLDMTGRWTFFIEVTEAEGLCEGETGDTSSPLITVNQNAAIFTASGFLGEPGNQLVGTIAGSRVNATGMFDEDGGVTTVTYDLIVYSPTLMEGTESWSWDADGTDPVDCPNGMSRVRAAPIIP